MDRPSPEAAARRAAQAAGVEITLLEGPVELRRAEAVARGIWGGSRPSGSPVGAELMQALAHSGSYVAGARAPDGRLVGVLVGFLGRDADGLQLHSHVLGVEPERQSGGAGLALKLHQRAWALERGIPTVRWTADPLVARNAHFNLAKLGAGLEAYLVNFYGQMHDEQNRGEESDRLLVRWDLRSERAESAARGDRLLADSAGAAVALDVDEGGEPRAGAVAPGRVLVRVPRDIVALRATDPALGNRWRMAAREVMAALLGDGRRCEGVSPDAAYVFAAR